MAEHRLFDPASPPDCTTPAWYQTREHAPHLEQDGHRQRLELAANMAETAIRQGAVTVVDVGAGDGGLLSLLPSQVKSWGYDLQPSNVKAAGRRGVDVQLGDVVDRPELLDFADLIVATEFLEHIADPHRMVQAMWDCGARWLVASSPYTETAESHYPFHLYAWDRDGYRQLIEGPGWRVVRHETAWISQCLLAERP